MATGLGIDIGSEWIKAVQVSVSGGKVTVTGALKIPRSGGGPGAEEDGGMHAVPPNLGQELSHARMRRSGCVGLTGKEVVLRYVTTPPMPPDKLRSYIDMQIGERVMVGKKEEGAPALTYDFRVLNVHGGPKGDLVIMAAAAKNEFLHGLVAACKAAGVSVNRMVPAAVGVAQAYLRTQQIQQKETVAVVDVGHEVLEISLLHEDALYFARSGPGGGRKFDVALSKLLGWPAEKLKEFKHHRAKVLPEGTAVSSPQDQQFQAALRDGSDGIANAIRGAVTFCRTQAKMPRVDYQRIFLSGGGARLQGLPEYLEKKTQRPVKILDLYSGLDLRRLDAQSAKCFEGAISDMSVALGLAVLDADPESFHLDLMPQSILKRRAFWGRTVFAMAAGVVLLASLWVPFQNAQKSLRAAQEKEKTLQESLDKAKELKSSFTKQVEENKKLALKREYYARQARLGPVYLNLFSATRESALRGMRFTHMGPRGEGGGADGPVMHASLMQELVFRGYYDLADLPNFDTVLDPQFFKKLRDVPGVKTVSLNAAYEGNAPAGCKAFEYTVELASPNQPIVILKPAAAPAPSGAPAAPAVPAAPAPAGGATDAGKGPAAKD
jgi:type IV pilus assembly protein PilM